jgi:hypothetical protein
VGSGWKRQLPPPRSPSKCAVARKRKDAYRAVGMRVYLFNSCGWNVRALALKASGVGLPAAYAPWQSVPTSEPWRSERLPETVVKALERDGFFLTSGTAAVFALPPHTTTRKRTKARPRAIA